MIRLDDIKPGLPLTGLEPAVIGSVVAVVPIAEGTVQVIYKTPDGALKDRLLNRVDETGLSIATTERPWSFEGDGEAFKLTVEAKRIDLAFLFDPMMAVHTSNVEALPHQITAVYESMLPRQPLRFVLADDPGAGKTIMAGLYIRELIMRADARRIVIVAPGSLVEQWRDEMFEKFGLDFRVFSRELESVTPSGNPFEDLDHLIVRLDQMSRNEELQEKLCAAGWDLVVFDEAHKLAAHFFGSKLEKTGRFKLAEKLGARTRHLLLMTATPHNGKEEDFQLFLSLLDSDRFYGKFRDGVHKVDTTDLMRRMVKEELVKFDGTPLFPERRAYTVNYKLSDIEAALYEAVTQYVKTEMGKADHLEGARKGSVGFALTSLQRRLASSPEAIFQSLKRRRERLQRRLREEQIGNRGAQILAETLAPPPPPSGFPGEGASPSPQLPAVPEDDDDLNAEEQEQLEESLVDQATAAKTIAELEDEIDILIGLESQARAVVASGQDRKWDELSRILQRDPHMLDAGGRLRKIIIFSEHRDTLNYLHEKIAGVLGSHDAIVIIHGGTHRDDRHKAQALFRSDPEIRVLVATDAAGEGVNLQCANLMVNYDLPWNPNRLEQRFGRIHRIGQQEVCHLWNLVAKETREGDVYFRLLEKIRVESEALKGRVFDILGEVFEGRSLKELLIEAIRYGDQPEVRARLRTRIDNNFDRQNLLALLDRNALAQETLGPERLFAVKEEMDKAEARRLQPYFVRSFFMKGFEALGGSIYPRELIRELNIVLPEALDEMTKGSGDERSPVAPVDLSQAIIGPGMAVFSKYAAVLEADGSPMSVRTALQLINRFLAEDDFDADTQFCLHWFEQHGWTESIFGEADVLARSKSTSVDAMKEAGVLQSGSGKVRLLKWSEYPADWDPRTDTRTPIWEALHQLIRALRQGGDSASGALLAALGGKAEAARQLAYRLYTLCERLGQAEDARAYNELITSWTGIESAAATAPQPAARDLPGFER
jgi:superfamily II DNA or RNA helicase